MKSHISIFATGLSVLLFSMTNSDLTAQIKYPSTAKDDQTDVYFGHKIADPYRWLENDTSARTEAWVVEQNKVTDNYLARIPYRRKIAERITDLWNYPRESAPRREGEWLVYSKNDGLQNQSIVYIKKLTGGSEEVLLDPNKLSSDGTVALQGLTFSKKQRYVSYSVSASGSDWQEILVLDMTTRKLLTEKLEHVKFSGMSWRGDEGFYYSAYEKPKDEKTKFSAKTEFQKLYYHKIGTPQSADILVYEDKDHPQRFVGGGLTEDERFLILSISEGTDGSEIKVKDLSNPSQSEFITLVEGFKTNSAVVDNLGDQIILLTNLDAPNFKAVLVNPRKPEVFNWKTLIAEQKEALEYVNTGGGKLFAGYLKDACSYIVQYTTAGTRERVVPLPGVGTVGGFGAKKTEKSFYYVFTSFTYPATVFQYDIATGKSTLYKKPEVKFNPDDFETRQVFYTSKDGTKVPMFITYKKGIQLNASNPTLLYAYGGFNVSLTPSFSVSTLAFLEQGGIYCLANLRGGAEYGEAWHKAGMLDKKQNVFDDFIAAAEYLIREKYTSSAKLAIMGGSNGGLLIGACMAQRPELFQVAFPQVGVLDMLRYHKFTIGYAWAVEYGSSDHEAQFNYLIRYSPLHNLKKGTCYPATLITTADHDDRVVPAHSFKFAATLQEAQACGNPALIRIESKAGHGAGKPTSKRIEELADIYSFLFFNMNAEIK